jgi:starch synthase
LAAPPTPPTLCTIHNLAYQGLFSYGEFTRLGLPFSLWSAQGVEFYGQVSFLKAGLQHAHWLTTVSKTYAQEIQQPELGYGLDGLLRARQHQLSGILNGVDYQAWNPRHDPLLPYHYSPEALTNKRLIKTELQAAFALAPQANTPLLAYIGRMAWQKGVDLILAALPELMAQGVQLLIQGSGESSLEHAFIEAMERYPEQLGVYIGYNEALAHQIEAGADIFLMPSRYEPCGLNQLYSLHYGTVPVVRRTGGLNDTVTDTDLITAVEQRASGFVFDAATPEALLYAVRRALAVYQRIPHWWEQIMLTGMRQDFSWQTSARDYLHLYRQLTAGA